MDSTALPLRDIHLPEPISIWPPAFGWWLLALLSILSIVASIYLIKYLIRKTAVKLAKKQLQQIQQNQQLSDLEKLGQLSMLIRRTAISIYPRTEVAKLTGNAWLAFLDDSIQDTSNNKNQFQQGSGRVLSYGPYQQTPVIDLDALFTLCQHWLKTVKSQRS